MMWESWAAFWNMGGRGAFVWGSYAVTALVMVIEVVLVMRRRKTTVRRLLQLRRAMPAASAGRLPGEIS